MKEQTFYGRYGLWILIAIVFLLPMTFRGARLALKSNHNDVKEWLPDEYRETQEFNWFRKYFAGEQFVLMSWPGCTLDDTTKLELLTADLRPPADEKLRQEHHKLISEVVTGPELLARITESAPPGTEALEARQQAHQRLAGLFIGPDQKTTCMVVTLSEYGSEHLRESVNTIRRRALESAQIARADLKMGGPPVDNVALDEEGESALIRLAAYSVLVGLVVSWWCLRSMPLVMMVFFTGAYGGMLGLAIVYYTGGAMNAILLTMPSLVYVAATSGAIHLANYYREAVMEHGTAGAPGLALRHALLPLSLATGTTTVGLLSLYISELVPIKSFGLYSAAGVTATIIPLMLLMPAMLENWPVTRSNTFKEFLLFFPTMFTWPLRWALRGFRSAPATEQAHAVAHHGPAPHAWVNPIEKLPWNKVGENVIRHNLLWIAGMTAVMAVCGWGVTQCQTSINLMRFFSDDSEIRRNYAWLEENLGPLVPMEVVVRFEPDCPLNMLERMQVIERVQHEVAALDEVGSAMSPATFVTALPTGSGFSPKRMAWKRGLERRREELLNSGYMKLGEGDDTGEELWRVSARVQALKDMDYGEFVKSLRDKVDPITARLNARFVAPRVWGDALAASGWIDSPPNAANDASPLLASAQPAVTQEVGEPATKSAAVEPSLADVPINVTYTGLVPLVYKAQRSLMDGLKLGFVGDWILIAIVMMIVVWDWSAGLLLMIPSVFPALVVFGVMGMMGIVVDTGTVMAPAVALGVTVDDVVHFMLKFRDKIREGGTRREAIMAAYGHCAQAMYQSWGVIGLGLSVFALSHFMPTQRFGWMMITLLTASTIGNLTLLPAVLASPLGLIFTWSTRRQTRKREEKAAAKAAKLATAAAASLAPHTGVVEGETATDDTAVAATAAKPVLPHSKPHDKNVRQDAPHSGRR